MMETQRIVCLGEALVDFVCERPVASLGDADFFVPRPGGSLANIAVAAARFGGRVEMLGGAGDDEWGRWLRDRMAADGVVVDRFVLMPRAGTSHAFVAVSAEGEPSFAFYGDPERPAAHAAGDVEGALQGGPGVFVIGSDTLLGNEERRVTMDAAILARERGWRVLCDPNLRPNRWETHAGMIDVIRALVALASVVKLNESEALALTRKDTAEEAARELLALGPDATVITRGPAGALVVEGAQAASVAGATAEVVDATGAGDCVAGVVAAGLSMGRPLTGVVGVAMEAAAGVVSAWGATEGMPSSERARALLEGLRP